MQEKMRAKLKRETGIPPRVQLSAEENRRQAEALLKAIEQRKKDELPTELAEMAQQAGEDQLLDPNDPTITPPEY